MDFRIDFRMGLDFMKYEVCGSPLDFGITGILAGY